MVNSTHYHNMFIYINMRQRISNMEDYKGFNFFKTWKRLVSNRTWTSYFIKRVKRYDSWDVDKFTYIVQESLPVNVCSWKYSLNNLMWVRLFEHVTRDENVWDDSNFVAKSERHILFKNWFHTLKKAKKTFEHILHLKCFSRRNNSEDVGCWKTWTARCASVSNGLWQALINTSLSWKTLKNYTRWP